jgi:polyhydroxyalkanoate synthesis regulator protein
MENFRTNQTKLQEAFTTSMGTDAFARMAETNMAMFKAAAAAFIPKAPAAANEQHRGDDLEALRKQMAEMQSKLDKLGG